MSHVKIKRYERDVSITLYTATADATTIRMDDMAGGVVNVGTMSTNASSIQIWGSNSEAGTYRRLYDASGAAADITLSPSSTAGRIYALPDACFALSWIKLVSATTSSTGTLGVVSLKS
jgi:hypothetical protein